MSDTAQKRAATLLAFDTSTAALACAIVRGGRVVRETGSLAERNHSVRIVPELQALLASCGLAADELDGIAVGQGPGSYTGVRIAVTVAKTLAWTWGKPLVGVSSLEALAYGARLADEAADGDWIVPIMDARRGQVFTGAFAGGDGRSWARLEPDGIRRLSDWAAGLAEQSTRLGAAGVAFVGDTAPFEETIRTAADWGGRLKLLPRTLQGGAVGLLGAVQLANGHTSEVHAFAPNYTQLAEAEVKLQAAAKAEKR